MKWTLEITNRHNWLREALRDFYASFVPTPKSNLED